jgi:hypothetical protein
MSEVRTPAVDLPAFDRNFWDGTFTFTRIGPGELGGKATGLAFISEVLLKSFDTTSCSGFDVDVPTMAVIATGFFDEFMEQNRLAELHFDQMSDAHIGNAFQHADLPVELVGDLRALIEQVHTPLAIRSSSLLEDALDHPFAGVYATKMIPNNQLDPDTRFRRLLEAVKFVYASTYFGEAREYIRSVGRDPSEEKMAIIIQEVVGRRHGDRFYPDVCGVARSYNFYPSGDARPEEGVVNLALGLGKTIVDGGISWPFSPSQPRRSPPFGSVQELMRGTQTEFWAINMGPPPAYDPVNEVEYMVQGTLLDAEADEVLSLIASTYDPTRDRVVCGVGASGPRILNFAPLLVHEELALTSVVKALLATAEAAVQDNVELEFAITLDQPRGEPVHARLGFLQVRPMVASRDVVEVSADELTCPAAVVGSEIAMGNGITENIRDVVFVRPERFAAQHTPAIAQEIGEINRKLREENRPYLLIGFGRWGSSHPSLGIPVNWSQISGARAIVEATLPQMNVDLSQGSHFFHNLSAFRASYLMVRHDSHLGIDWAWLNRQPVVQDMEWVRHARSSDALSVRVDGRTGRGVVLRETATNANQRT